MKLELKECGYYKMRNGNVVGPIFEQDGEWVQDDGVDGLFPMWDINTGKCAFFMTQGENDEDSQYDLVEEATPMKLEVGKTYYDPDDDAQCTIVKRDDSDNTFQCDRGNWFKGDGRYITGYYRLEEVGDTATQNRPITFLSAVDALAEDHGLTVTECSVSEGVYTLVVVGD